MLPIIIYHLLKLFFGILFFFLTKLLQFFGQIEQMDEAILIDEIVQGCVIFDTQLLFILGILILVLILVIVIIILVVIVILGKVT